LLVCHQKYHYLRVLRKRYAARRALRATGEEAASDLHPHRQG